MTSRRRARCTPVCIYMHVATQTRLWSARHFAEMSLLCMYGSGKMQRGVETIGGISIKSARLRKNKKYTISSMYKLPRLFNPARHDRQREPRRPRRPKPVPRRAQLISHSFSQTSRNQHHDSAWVLGQIPKVEIFKEKCGSSPFIIRDALHVAPSALPKITKTCPSPDADISSDPMFP